MAYLDLRVNSSVCVVGGGWAGMAAAVELAGAGVPVTVFEAASVLGGRARRVNFQGTVLDNGQHLLLGAYRETLAAIARVTDSATVLRRTPLHIEMTGELCLVAGRGPAPLHLLLGLMGARGLTWRERLEAVRLLTAARLAGFRVERPGTVEEFLAHHRQPAALRRALWEPLCIAALNTGPEIADAQTFLNVLRDGLAAGRAASDLVFPRVDLSAMFPEPAAAFVAARGGSVHLGEPVTSITALGAGFEITTAARRAPFEHVIWATDPVRAGRALSGLGGLQTVCESIDRLEHAPIVTVYLRYDVPGALFAQGMTGDNRGPAQWFFDRGLLCGQPGWVGAVLSAASRWRGIPREDLAARVARQAQPLVADRLPSEHLVVTEKRATLQCVPNLRRPDQRTPLPRLHLAGDYTASDYPATLESAVRSGRLCARAVLEAP